jgi:hypothetical protein
MTRLHDKTPTPRFAVYSAGRSAARLLASPSSLGS